MILCLSKASHRGLIRFVLVHLGSGMGYNPHHYDTAGVGAQLGRYILLPENKYKRGPSTLVPLDISICTRCLDLQDAWERVYARGRQGGELGGPWILCRCHPEVTHLHTSSDA